VSSTIYVLTLHAVWSISTSIALAESLVPDRATRPWFGWARTGGDGCRAGISWATSKNVIWRPEPVGLDGEVACGIVRTTWG
jgi:hypothetical protein